MKKKAANPARSCSARSAPNTLSSLRTAPRSKRGSTPSTATTKARRKTGGPYHLVTKTTQGAMVAGSEEPESVRTTKTGYSGTGSQENIGWKLRKPTSVTTDPNGLDLVHAIEYEPSTGAVKETKTPAATGHDVKVPPTYSLDFGSEGTAGGQFSGPEHEALDNHGDQWVTDYGNNRIEELSSAGKFMLAVGWGVKDGKAEAETCTSECKAGISGSGKAQFNGPVGIAINQTNNDIYVADFGNNRIEELSSAGGWLATIGAKGTAGGDFSSPEGLTIDSSGDLWVADAANSRIQELSSSGTFMLAVGWGVKDGKAEAETCTSSCEAGISGSGNGQLAGPNALAFSGGDFYVADYGNDRVDEFTTAGVYVAKFGEKGTGAGQFEGPHDIATEAATGDLYVLDKNDGRVQKFTTAGGFLSTFATEGSGNGQLEAAQGLAINASGDLYAVDSGADRVEEWVPTITGNEGAHDTKTVYYTAKEEAEVGECRNHPEWAGLPCQTGPVAQPGTSGLPELPVTTYKEYNLWLEPTSIVETVGTTAPIPTRTRTLTYDAAGRPKTTSITATVGTAMSTVTDGYTAKEGAETGAMTTQSTLVEGKTLTITSVLNTRGELVSYTDASGVTSTYEYDEDERLHKTNDGKGTQTLTYSKTTGLPSELVDSAHEGMKFTATWDVEGNMLSESYPNGMTAYHTYNPTGAATGLEYKKLTDCTEEKEKCKWFTDTVVPSIHGQWLSQTSTFSKQAYAYNNAGALTQVQNTPTGKPCTTRIYALDEDVNRTSLTTRESASEKCATEGGTTESHTYDSADRLTDPGVVYSEFGDITTLPASDANGKPPLKISRAPITSITSSRRRPRTNKRSATTSTPTDARWKRSRPAKKSPTSPPTTRAPAANRPGPPTPPAKRAATSTASTASSWPSRTIPNSRC
jgi:YD repeat-containing protein